jgi:GMP synthase-like glutamine amidotransferase
MTSTSSSDNDRIILSKTVFFSPNSRCSATARVDDDAYFMRLQHPINGDDTSKGDSKELSLMMMSCEENPPYGPSKDTAIMFLELLCQAYEKHCNIMQRQQIYGGSLTICITVYHAQLIDDYPVTPQEWSSYDGVIIPGSLSAAYDNKNVAWIEKLQSVIRNDIHRMRIKTLGVCFGHQCFAHAFGGTTTACDNRGSDEGGTNEWGRAIKCPTGSKAGRISSQLTHEGRRLLLLDDSYSNNDSNDTNYSIELLYTHGDMVHSLPEFAISLGGNTDVPIEACAYFSSKEEKIQFQKQILNQQRQQQQATTTTKAKVQPYAVTFQAHPEYVSPTGFNVNYINTVQAMEDHGYITPQMSREVCEDAKVNFERVQEDSLNAMIGVAVALEWF